MVLLKLTLLTLLIAALDLHALDLPDIPGENSLTYDGADEGLTCPIIVTCQGRTAVLNCGYRRIRIIGAFYGRTDSTTCATGCRRRQLRNRSCYSHTARFIVKSRCDGRRRCRVSASNRVFSNPCRGTYKYLRITYACR